MDSEKGGGLGSRWAGWDLGEPGGLPGPNEAPQTVAGPTPHRLGNFLHDAHPTFFPSARISTAPHLSKWVFQERSDGVPLPQASPCPSWKASVHSANSPEGKESHHSHGDQQLDQQDGIDLREGMISLGRLGEPQQVSEKTPAPRDSFESSPPYWILDTSALLHRATGQIRTSGGTGRVPDPQAERPTEPRGQGETFEARARSCQEPGWWERGEALCKQRLGQFLPGIPAQDPKPPLPSLQPSIREVVTFLMKSRRTFWSSQLKVVKSSWCPAGKPPS